MSGGAPSPNLECIFNTEDRRGAGCSSGLLLMCGLCGGPVRTSTLAGRGLLYHFKPEPAAVNYSEGCRYLQHFTKQTKQSMAILNEAESNSPATH